MPRSSESVKKTHGISRSTRVGLDSADEGQPVDSGHLAVNHDRGGLNFRRQPQSLGATLALDQAISIRFDQLFEPFDERSRWDRSPAGWGVDATVGSDRATRISSSAQLSR